MFLTIVDWLNSNQGVADWVGGLGSIGAIGGVWWQSKRERDNIIEQIRHDEKVNSERLKKENRDNLIQNWRIYQGHLQNTRTVLLNFNMVIMSAYKEKKDFRDKDISFLNDSIQTLLKSLESSMREISMYKTIAKVSDNSIKIDINYSHKVLQPTYNLQLALNSQLEFSERNKSVHQNICEMYNGIFIYTSKILAPEIDCIDKKISA